MNGIGSLVVAVALAAASGAGQTVVVKREGTRLMKAPRFFGKSCDVGVAAGAKVKLLEIRKGWARIAAPGNGACWLHESAWSDREAGELAGGTGKASQRDVELAGRGFSEAEEKRYRGEHKDLDKAFEAVEAHLARGAETPPETLAKFLAEGKLGGQP
jgi:hypothetical protein